MIHLNSAIEGLTFTTTKDPTEYTCVGYAQNETFVIVGASWDQASNRTSLKTFKLSEVQFKGQIVPK